jgi:hypothetical protein
VIGRQPIRRSRAACRFPSPEETSPRRHQAEERDQPLFFPHAKIHGPALAQPPQQRLGNPGLPAGAFSETFLGKRPGGGASGKSCHLKPGPGKGRRGVAAYAKLWALAGRARTGGPLAGGHDPRRGIRGDQAAAGRGGGREATPRTPTGAVAERGRQGRGEAAPPPEAQIGVNAPQAAPHPPRAGVCPPGAARRGRGATSAACGPVGGAVVRAGRRHAAFIVDPRPPERQDRRISLRRPAARTCGDALVSAMESACAVPVGPSPDPASEQRVSGGMHARSAQGVAQAGRTEVSTRPPTARRPPGTCRSGRRRKAPQAGDCPHAGGPPPRPAATLRA